MAFADRFKVYVTPFAERGSGLDISGTAPQFPVKQLSVRAGENISWSGNSQQLYWNLGPELYHADMTVIFELQLDKGSKKEFAAKNGQNISFKTEAYLPEGVTAFVGGQVITYGR